MPSIHPSYKDNKTNTHDMLDEVHSGFHAFVDGIESLSVEVNVRSFTGLNSPIIWVNVMDIILEVEFCPTADKLQVVNNIRNVRWYDIHQHLKKKVMTLMRYAALKVCGMTYNRQVQGSSQNESTLSRNGTVNNCRRVNQVHSSWTKNNLR